MNVKRERRKEELSSWAVAAQLRVLSFQSCLNQSSFPWIVQFVWADVKAHPNSGSD